MEDHKNIIDENLYSRQLFVLGHEAMKKMAQSNVLVIGANSLGVEISKNCILSGINMLTLYDTNVVTFKDFSGHFYLSEKDLGKNRSESCIAKLKELNNYVKVESYIGELNDDFLKNFSVIVYCLDINIQKLIKLNNTCRKLGIKFIFGQSVGLAGMVFNDFGDNFLVNDINGEQVKSSMIQNLKLDKNGDLLVTCIETKPHDLQTGQYVKFIDLVDLEGLDKVKINKIIDRYTFICNIGDLKLKNYVSGQNCLFEQVKITHNINFKSLKDSIENPDFIFCDLSNFDKPTILHNCFTLLDKFISTNNRYPTPYDEKDFNTFIKDFNYSENKDIYKKFCFTCSGNISPINSVIGGIISQEVLKACSGKFMPIKQLLYFDSFECLSDNWITMNKSEFKFEKNRYQGQMDVFGKSFQQIIADKKYFVVGSGAISCELLKNFAMIGLGTDKGKIIVTDMDTIEKSNLNRQFLFRDKNIGQLKSEAAALAIKKMNPDINIIPHQNRVGKETENIYNDDFFNHIDGVANALDNVQARLYMDERCIYYGKSLLESGTLGAKGNVQVIVPNLTESYGSTRDPPEESVPVCTLKNFPYQIEHTIQYARDQFEGLFTTSPLNFKRYLENPEFLNELKKDSIQEFYLVVKDIHNFTNIIPNNFQDCVTWARLFFEKQYNNQIKQLLHNFPSNHLTSNGAKFWSGQKRCPKPLVFNKNVKEHIDFIIFGANMMARIYDIENETNVDAIHKYLENVNVPEFKPKDGIKISENDKEEKELEQEKPLNINEIISDLPKHNEYKLKIYPQEFEKDNDLNFHMDFITASSNLRAINYGIKPVSKHKTKGIAGKIIPAIATTTAIVAGLVTLELYKLCQNHKDIEKYRDTFLNLALFQMTTCEPKPCKKLRYLNKEYTLWDFIEIETDGNLTLSEFIDICKNIHGFDIDILSYGNSILYAFYQSPIDLQNKIDKTIPEIIKEVCKVDVSNNKTLLLYTSTHLPDDEDEEMEVPPIKLIIRKNNNKNIKAVFAQKL